MKGFDIFRPLPPSVLERPRRVPRHPLEERPQFVRLKVTPTSLEVIHMVDCFRTKKGPLPMA